MNPLHIVRVTEQFPPKPGGLAPGMLALSQAQHQRGHRITIMTPDVKGADIADQQLPFQVVRVPSKSFLHFGWQTVPLLREMGDNIDLIQGHGPAIASILFRWRQCSIPVVETFHSIRRYQAEAYQALHQEVECFSAQTGLTPLQYPRSFRYWSPHMIRELLLEKYICRHADHLVLVAPYFKSKLAEYYRVPSANCTVIYNGSDFNNRNPETKADQQVLSSPILNDFLLYKEEQIILFVGRFDWQKRIHLLVQAMPSILEQCPQTRLILVGDGEQKADLENLVATKGLEDSVWMPGWIPHEQLSKLYEGASCFCLPSMSEGLSKVMLEAMSMGVPVVASNIPANADILDNGSLGILVSEAKPDSWAEVLIQLLQNSTQAQARAQLAIQAVENQYRWEHVASRLDQAYEKVLN